MTTNDWAAAAEARALVVVQVEPDDQPFGTETTRTVDGSDGHHLQRARRLRIGEAVVVADGSGSWYSAEVTALGAGEITVDRRSEPAVEPVPVPRLTIAFAPARVDHGSDVVHQLVELGVDEIALLRTERSVVRWDGDRLPKQMARLRRVAREAAMQSHRATVPPVTGPFEPFQWSGRDGVVVADRAGTAPLADLVGSHPAITVLVGPEGGFTDADLSGLDDAPRFALGVHTLRAVTAPIAIAAALVAGRCL